MNMQLKAYLVYRYQILVHLNRQRDTWDTAVALPLSNHCLPVSFFSLGAVNADSGINLKVEATSFKMDIIIQTNI